MTIPNEQARVDESLKLAQEYAEIARLWMLASHDEHDDRQAYGRARMAARLAFRAMPELRGEP